MVVVVTVTARQCGLRVRNICRIAGGTNRSDRERGGEGDGEIGTAITIDLEHPRAAIVSISCSTSADVNGLSPSSGYHYE